VKQHLSEINTTRKTNKHRTWWRKCTDERACLCTQMSGSHLTEGIWCGYVQKFNKGVFVQH